MRSLYPGMPEFAFELPGDDLMLSVIVAIVHGKHAVGVDPRKHDVEMFAQDLGMGCPIFPVDHSGVGVIL